MVLARSPRIPETTSYPRVRLVRSMSLLSARKLHWVCRCRASASDNNDLKKDDLLENLEVKYPYSRRPEWKVIEKEVRFNRRLCLN